MLNRACHGKVMFIPERDPNLPGGCTMKRLMIGLTAFAAIGLWGSQLRLRGDEPAKDQSKADPAKVLSALQKEWTDAQQAFRKAYEEAKTDEERQQVVK